MSKPRPPTGRVSLVTRITLPACHVQYPGGPKQVLMSIASLSVQPSPGKRRVGVRIDSFEACSDFTRIMARWIAQPPMAAFVTRLQSGRLLVQTARQLPDQSTTLWVEPSSTGDTRPRGALLPPSSLRSLLLKNLTPASGCQDHTTSPSASSALVCSAISVHRNPLHVRDDRETPLWRSGMIRSTPVSTWPSS
jgi:hypothetical protein